MKSYSKDLQLFFYRFVLALGFYQLARLVFLVFNSSVFLKVGFWSILSSFWYGLIFDIPTFVYFNGLFLFFSVLPFISKQHRYYQGFLAFLFYIGNAVVLLLNLIDTGYFPFASKRSGVELFVKQSEGGDNMIMRYLIDFWYLFLLWAVLVFGMIWLYRKKKEIHFFIYIKNKFTSSLFQAVVFLLLASLSVLGARGGFYLRPLRSVDATRFVDPVLVPLALNTPFQIISTVESPAVRSFNWMNKKEALYWINPIKKYNTVKEQKKNVVILILESFGREYVGFYNHGKGYTPFLDSLSQHSLVFTRAYANGKTSMDGIPAILSSICFIDEVSFITSPYQTNTITSIGKELRKNGYATAFYHGGQNGTMGFNSFIRLAGFEHYYGLDEYPMVEDYDGFWGIPDQKYLHYVGDQLQQTKQPFCVSVFTLSSHHPYIVPAPYERDFPKGTLPIHQTIGYTDFSLKQFFNHIKTMDWYSNTLFVITSDHSAENATPYYSSLTGKYLIPLLIVDPSHELKGTCSKVTQQLDIMPSLLQYLGYDKPFFSFGNSVFDEQNKGWAFQFENGSYQFIQWPYSLLFNGEKQVGLYQLDQDSLLVHNLVNRNSSFSVDSCELKLKSFLQQYTDALHQNKMEVGN